MSIATTTFTATKVQTPAKASITRWAERALWLAWIPVVLYTVFFSAIPNIHNGMHPIRHSTTVVQCH
ncbi:MAG: CbtB-domain containing protein [Mariprofundales bacterium]|nr:CbtB-domain containing protein [Mariprofundales bacterium]